MYQYPYGNAQQLNLDWILGKIQELEAGSTSVNIEAVANALVSASFDAGVSYRRYDYCFYNGKLYRALNDTTGAFNPADWLEVVIGDDIPVLTRLLNAVDTSLTSLQNTVNDLDSDDIDNASTVVSGATVTAALETLNTAITSLLNALDDLDSDDVDNASLVVSGATVTAALETLNTAITSLQNADDVILSSIAYVEETNMATRTYAVGDYVYIKQYERLYRITTATPTGTTLVGHIAYMVNGGLNDVPFAVPVDVTPISNTYIDLTQAHSFFYIYKLGNIYVGKYRLAMLVTMPTGTADFRFAACSLPNNLTSDAFFNALSTVASSGQLQLKITAAGNVYASNTSGAAAEGFFNGSFVAF